MGGQRKIGYYTIGLMRWGDVNTVNSGFIQDTLQGALNHQCIDVTMRITKIDSET